jgi:hypothetical protein
MKKVEELVKNWGSLPAKDREANMRALVKDMPPRYREIIQEYYRRISTQEGGR